MPAPDFFSYPPVSTQFAARLIFKLTVVFSLEAVLTHLLDAPRHVVGDLTDDLRHAVILGGLHSGGAHLSYRVFGSGVLC